MIIFHPRDGRENSLPQCATTTDRHLCCDDAGRGAYRANGPKQRKNNHDNKRGELVKASSGPSVLLRFYSATKVFKEGKPSFFSDSRDSIL